MCWVLLFVETPLFELGFAPKSHERLRRCRCVPASRLIHDMTPSVFSLGRRFGAGESIESIAGLFLRRASSVLRKQNHECLTLDSCLTLGKSRRGKEV